MIYFLRLMKIHLMVSRTLLHSNLSMVHGSFNMKFSEWHYMTPNLDLIQLRSTLDGMILWMPPVVLIRHLFTKIQCLEAYERSELCFAKNVFCSKKLLFAPFLWTAKLKMDFFSILVPIILCSNLFSKLFEIGEKWLKNPFSFLAVYKKGAKSNFLEQNTVFL